MSKEIVKVKVQNNPAFAEFSNTMLSTVQDHAKKKSTEKGTFILSTPKQAVQEIPIETLIEQFHSQQDKRVIELTPEQGNFYLQLIAIAYDIIVTTDYEKDEKLRRYVKTCKARFDNIDTR